MVDFRGRMAIRSSEWRQAEDKNSGIEKQSHGWRCVHITLALEVSSKPGPFQIKGAGTQILPFAKRVPPAKIIYTSLRIEGSRSKAATRFHTFRSNQFQMFLTDSFKTPIPMNEANMAHSAVVCTEVNRCSSSWLTYTVLP